MTIINFPRQKPRPGEFELPRAQICGLAQTAGAAVLNAATAIAAAETAEEFAEAIAAAHATLAEHAAGFAQLADRTAGWRKPER